MGRRAPPKIVGESNGHVWAEWVFTSRTMICCNKCGLVRRADGTSNPCKGAVKVAMRIPMGVRGIPLALNVATPARVVADTCGKGNRVPRHRHLDEIDGDTFK